MKLKKRIFFGKGGEFFLIIDVDITPQSPIKHDRTFASVSKKMDDHRFDRRDAGAGGHKEKRGGRRLVHRKIAERIKKGELISQTKRVEAGRSRTPLHQVDAEFDHLFF